MKEAWRYARAYALVFICMMFLGAGMKTQAAGVPQVSGLKQIKAGATNVEVSWDAVMADGIRYEIEVSDSESFSSVRTQDAYTWTDRTISSLSAGKKYYVRVKAYVYNSGTKVYGTPSAALEVVTAPDSNIKRNFRQTGAGLTSVTLQWDKKEDANAYRLEYYKVGESKTTHTLPLLGNVQTCTVKKLSKDTEYAFRLYPVMKGRSYEAVPSFASDYLTDCRVLPGKVDGLEVSFSTPTTKYIDLSWDRRDTADGYQYEVYSLAGKKAKKIITRKISYKSELYSSNKLSKAQFLKVRVRAYINLGKNTKYGEWSKWIYTSKQPEVTGRKSLKNGIKLSWKKVAGANSYTVWISKSNKTGFKKVKTLSGTSLTIKKCGKSSLKRKKAYYCIVVANKKIGKKTYQGIKTYPEYVYYYYYSY